MVRHKNENKIVQSNLIFNLFHLISFQMLKNQINYKEIITNVVKNQLNTNKFLIFYKIYGIYENMNNSNNNQHNDEIDLMEILQEFNTNDLINIYKLIDKILNNLQLNDFFLKYSKFINYNTILCNCINGNCDVTLLNSVLAGVQFANFTDAPKNSKFSYLNVWNTTRRLNDVLYKALNTLLVGQSAAIVWNRGNKSFFDVLVDVNRIQQSYSKLNSTCNDTDDKPEEDEEEPSSDSEKWHTL